MSEPASRPYRVLAVDDEKAVLRGYSSVLGQSLGSAETALDGMEAELFGDERLTDPRLPRIELQLRLGGAAAVEAVRKAVLEGKPYAIAFMDVRMPPGMDGVGAAAQIRGIDAQIEIVFVTAYADLEAEVKALQIQPLDKLYFINKPFEGDHMRALTIALCQKWSGVEPSSPKELQILEHASFANRPAMSIRFPQLNEVLGLR